MYDIFYKKRWEFKVMERIFKEHSFRKITSLNGDWKFCIDQNNIGENEQWYKNFPQNFIILHIQYKTTFGDCQPISQEKYGYFSQLPVLNRSK